MTKRLWPPIVATGTLAVAMLVAPFLPDRQATQVRIAVLFILAGAAIVGWVIAYRQGRNAAGRGPRK